jgi:hypothetical protein
MPRITEGALPPQGMPAVLGDFNARGLSGDASDDCIYWLDAEAIERVGAEVGSAIFVYERDQAEDGTPEIFGFVCSLERVPWAEGRWRGRPNRDTWFRGEAPWKDAHDV